MCMRVAILVALIACVLMQIYLIGFVVVCHCMQNVNLIPYGACRTIFGIVIMNGVLVVLVQIVLLSILLGCVAMLRIKWRRLLVFVFLLRRTLFSTISNAVCFLTVAGGICYA